MSNKTGPKAELLRYMYGGGGRSVVVCTESGHPVLSEQAHEDLRVFEEKQYVDALRCMQSNHLVWYDPTANGRTYRLTRRGRHQAARLVSKSRAA